MSIFKSYDIRGKVPEELNEQLAYKIGRAFIKHTGAAKVIVGRDCRTSSPDLQRALMTGLVEQGATVIDIGQCSTPLLYYASWKHPAIMITASHLPKEYNGLKMCNKGAQPIGMKTGLNIIEHYTYSDYPKAQKKGAILAANYTDSYITHCLRFANNNIQPFTIVIDAGNGMGGPTMKKLLQNIPCKLIPLYFEPDGTFPNHEANPLKQETLKDIIEEVKKQQADLGVALDADADRIILIDETGMPLSGDITLGILALAALKKQPKATILYDLRSTRALPEQITTAGGTAIQTPVGHSNIKPLLTKHKALIAGEISGHYYYYDNKNAESPEITLLLILNLMSAENKKLSELAAPFKKYHHSGEINFHVQDIQKTMTTLEKKYSDAIIDKLDGTTFTYPDWWFNTRPSQTEPVLRLVIEAKTQEKLKEKIEEISEIIMQT